MSDVNASAGTGGQGTGVAVPAAVPGAAVTPQSTAAPIGVSTDPGQAQVSGDWYGKFPDELKGFVQTKGFKDPLSVVDSYRNLEKLMGGPKERLIRLPDKADAPEWDDVYSKLGRPATAKDYALEIPAGVDPEFGKWAADNFHKLGVTKTQGESLIKAWNQRMAGAVQAQTSAQSAQIEADGKSLQKEWGAAFEQNATVVDNVAAKFGMSAEQLQGLRDVMGAAGAMKFLHNIGTKMGEHNFVTPDSGNSGFGALTPEAARQQIAALKSDPSFVKNYLAGEIQAKQKMEQLHRMAYHE